LGTASRRPEDVQATLAAYTARTIADAIVKLAGLSPSRVYVCGGGASNPVLMASLASEGMTMLLVTHEIAFARDVSSRVLFFDKGVIAEEGSPEILRNPESERLQQFLHRILHDRVAHSVSKSSGEGAQA
ncbi:MAG: hypothetical protein EOP94_05080, partial [Zymomonas sp.]